MPDDSENKKDLNYYSENISLDVDAQDKKPDVADKKPEPKKPKEKTWIKSLRTYKDDVENILKKGGGSMTRIVLAEKERKRKAKVLEEERERNKNAELLRKKRDREAKAKEVPTPTPVPPKPEPVHQTPKTPETKRGIPFHQKMSPPLEAYAKPEETHGLKVRRTAPPPPNIPGAHDTRPPVQQKESPPSSQLDTGNVPEASQAPRAHYEDLPKNLAGRIKQFATSATLRPKKLVKRGEHLREGTVGAPEEMAIKEEEAPTLGHLIKQNIVAIILSVLVFALGMGMIYGAYLLVQNNREPETKPFVTSSGTIIVVDTQKQIGLSGLGEQELRNKVADEKSNEILKKGQIESIYFTKSANGTSEESEEVTEKPRGVLGIREIFFIIQNNIPSALLRTWGGDDFLFGLHGNDKNESFLIIKVDSFENAFAGMLKWERFMLDDLETLFAIGDVKQFVSGRVFVDEVIKNREIRVLKDTSGAAVLLYSFVDKETLVITTHENTFNEVVDRLKAPKKIIR